MFSDPCLLGETSFLNFDKILTEYERKKPKNHKQTTKQKPKQNKNQNKKKKPNQENDCSYEQPLLHYHRTLTWTCLMLRNFLVPCPLFVLVSHRSALMAQSQNVSEGTFSTPYCQRKCSCNGPI